MRVGGYFSANAISVVHTKPKIPLYCNLSTSSSTFHHPHPHKTSAFLFPHNYDDIAKHYLEVGWVPHLREVVHEQCIFFKPPRLLIDSMWSDTNFAQEKVIFIQLLESPIFPYCLSFKCQRIKLQ